MGREHRRTATEVEEIIAGRKKLEEINRMHFSSGDWKRLLLESGEARSDQQLIKTCFEDLLSASDCCELLLKYPELKSSCTAWSEFSGNNWKDLVLQDKDFYANKCDENDAWNKFYHKQITALLYVYPEFAGKVHLQRLSAQEWHQLLPKYPEILKSFRKSQSKIFYYDKFMETVQAAELVEQETGQSITGYFDWVQFDLYDWNRMVRKKKILMEKYFKKYYPKKILPTILSEAMAMVAENTENWENRYEWADWKCQKLREEQKEAVLICLRDHPELRQVTELYNMILRQFRENNYPDNILCHKELFENYKRFIKEYEESCPDIIQIIRGEKVTVTKIVPAKTETAAKETCNESNNP